MRWSTRWAIVAVVCSVLAGCITQSLTTPSTSLTYGWVMVHSSDPGGHQWGLQIGPKVDGSGSHVAIYAWRNCPTMGPCEWDLFQEFQALEPGSTHNYSIVWSNAGWVLAMDGTQVALLNMGDPSDAVTEWNPAERTSS